MKKILTIFLSLLIAISSFAADRLANSTDVATWSPSTFGQVQLNDYIIDTPFSTSGGFGQIFINNLATKMAGLRFGGTIWLDATALPDLFNIYMSNNGTLWTGVSDLDHPIVIRPLGGQIKVVATAASNTARGWLLADIKNVEINGYQETFTGMKHDWSGPLHNSFGFVISGGTTLNDDAFQLFVGGPSGLESIDIVNVEIEHGFCGIRANVETAALTMARFSIIRCYIHDSLEGEGAYLGKTSAAPYVEYEEMIIRDVFVIRAAAEAIQLQHMISNANNPLQERFVVVSADGRWKHPFEPFQDSGIQHVADQGKNTLRYGIVDGAANTMLSILSGTSGTPTGDPIVFEKMVFTDGRDRGVYTSSGVDNGNTWILRDLYFKDFNNSYPELTETSANTHVISQNGDDDFHFINITKDDTKANMFENTAMVQSIIGSANDNAMPDLEYRVPAFPGVAANKYEQWAEEYTISPRVGDKIDYELNDQVSMWIPGTSYLFYHCILAHTSSASTHPGSAPTYWTQTFWDEEGDPTYSVDFDAGDTLTPYPWDDYRLVSDNIWNQRGMGTGANERNTNYTTFQWFIDGNGDDTGNLQLSGEKDPTTMAKQPEDFGKYVRCKAYVKLAGGSIVESWLNSWTLVN